MAQFRKGKELVLSNQTRTANNQVPDQQRRDFEVKNKVGHPLEFASGINCRMLFVVTTPA
jgi:hypothetical protein